MNDPLIQRFQAARRDSGLVVLEGFHALKHALRFGAEVIEAVAVDVGALKELAGELAPDLAGELAPDLAGGLGERLRPIDAELLAELAPRAPRTGVIAIARRPRVDVAAVLAEGRPAPVVLLEEPRNMGNMGACVRVAAAADAAAVLTIGRNDPWHPDAVRGAAGLHFALPVAAVEEPPAAIEGPPRSDRPLIALDPDGDPLRPDELPPRAVLAFGAERHGLSPQLLSRADARLRIPMKPGVSSLNLATSVAAVLFAARLADG